MGNQSNSERLRIWTTWKIRNSEKEEVIDYEKEYMEEINDLIKEQEEMLNETVE